MVETVSLREVARIDRKSVAPENIETGSKYVGLENIESGGRLINVGTVANGELASSKFQFTGEHVLYGKLRPYLGKIALPEFGGICSTDILPVLPGPRLDRRFLVHFLRQPSKVRWANSMATGANLPRLSPTALGEMVVPLPPLDEQRRIAAILDHADELRTKRRQAIAHLDVLNQSVFHDMFAADKLDTVEFSTVCRRITDGTHQSPEWSDKGIPFLFISNVSTGEISLNSKKFISELEWQKLTARCPVEVGDILYTTVGSYGIPAIVRTEEKFAFQRHIAHIKPKTDLLHPEFTKAMLASDSLVRQADEAAVGVAQKTLNLQAIKKFKVMVPPMKDQREFARRTESVRRLKDWQQAQLAELEVLFASLQHRAFRGEL